MRSRRIWTGATAQQIDALLTSLPGVLLLNVSHKISEGGGRPV